MKEKVGGRDYYRLGGVFFNRGHKMDCCSCRFMPDAVCLAHYNGSYKGKYRPELSAAIDNAGNCSRYIKSWREGWKTLFSEVRIIVNWKVWFWDTIFHITERLKLEKLGLYAVNRWSY